MENNNDSSAPITKDDLISAISAAMREKPSGKEEQQTQTNSQPSKDEIFEAVEKYLEQKESQRKAKDILDKADSISSEEAEQKSSLISPPVDYIESLRMQLERHIDNIREMLTYGDYPSELFDSTNKSKSTQAYRSFWHCICYNKGGKEGSEFILNQMKSKGIKEPSAYRFNY